MHLVVSSLVGENRHSCFACIEQHDDIPKYSGPVMKLRPICFLLCCRPSVLRYLPTMIRVAWRQQMCSEKQMQSCCGSSAGPDTVMANREFCFSHLSRLTDDVTTPVDTCVKHEVLRR